MSATNFMKILVDYGSKLKIFISSNGFEVFKFQQHDAFKNNRLGTIIFKHLIKTIHFLCTPFHGQNFKT